MQLHLKDSHQRVSASSTSVPEMLLDADWPLADGRWWKEV
jgi:hypothetical protein